MNRKERLAEFAERVAADPGAVRDSSDCGRYLAVNPMADEMELLEELGIKPSACNKVDLYWEYEDDVKFVEIQTEEYAAGRTPGIYARKAPSGYINIVVVVREPVISTEGVHVALGLVLRSKIANARLSDKLQKM